MKQSLKRWTALLLALVMTASLIPGVTLPAAAGQQDTVGTLDHTDVISLPITIRNFAADGMLFEWDGIGGGVYEEKPFRNPYNTSNITDPVPYVGANLALGQLFCNDWDVSRQHLAADDRDGLTYHYGETYDSRYAHIAPANSGWHEYTVWNSNVAHGNDTNYMVIRFRSTGDPFQDTLYVKRYKNDNEYWQSGVDLTVSSAYGAYKLVGTEDGWTTIAVDLNAGSIFHPRQGNEYASAPGQNDAISKISIGFNKNHNYVMDISFIAFFIRDHNNGDYEDNFRYAAYDFINQDYCFRMDEPAITMVEPKPLIGINVLVPSTIPSGLANGSTIVNKSSSNTDPDHDWDKYLLINNTTATLWTGSSAAESGRFIAVRCEDVNQNLQVMVNGSPAWSFNPSAITQAGGSIKEVRTEICKDCTDSSNPVNVTWKTIVFDRGEGTGAVNSLGLQVSGSIKLAYLGLFSQYEALSTSGYNYNYDARVFVFEDYSYRHDRAAYQTRIEQYQVYKSGNAIKFNRPNGSGGWEAFDPSVMYNNENNYMLGGSEVTFSNTPTETGTMNGTVQQVSNGWRYLSLIDTGNERGVGQRTVLMTGLNKKAEDLRYCLVSYSVKKKIDPYDSNHLLPDGDTVPMYVMLDTTKPEDMGDDYDPSDAASGFNYENVTLGFFDAVADGGWHVDVLDLSECVSRSPNGETFSYKAFDKNAMIQRIGLVDGWAINGIELQVGYLAFFPTKKAAEQYGNAYSEANDLYNFGDLSSTETFSVITDAFTAKAGYQLGNDVAWDGLHGEKKFRVGSNNGFELIDPDYAYSNSNYRSGLPNYYPDMGFGEWVKNNSNYTNYNAGPNGEIGYYNDPQYRNGIITDNRTRDLETNGASGIWASSDDSYGYIMGLTERQLGPDGLPRYRQEVVQYLAQLLQKALCVPRTFMYDGCQYYSANFVQGDVDGSRFGYYDEAEPGQPENVNAMFPRDYAGWLRFQLGVTERDGSRKVDPITGENATGDIGGYEDTLGRSADLLSNNPALGMHCISTWTDAAYYMLNTLYLETGGSDTIPEYKYLQLVREQPKDGGASYYVFDTSYTNILFDFDRGIIGNNGKYKNPDTAIKDTTNGVVATYAFLPILRELPEFQGTFPYLKDTGIATKDDGADSYYNRDYNFSLECHGTFTYYRDKDLFFEFNGDDDVYLYVNGVCVLDIGGGHRPANQRIKLNDYVDHNLLQLADGENYAFDFFYLERHGTGSNLRIETNMEVYGDKIVTTKAAEQGGRVLEDFSDADFTQPVSYSYSITHTGDALEVMTDFAFNDDSIGFYAGFDNVKLGQEEIGGADRQVNQLGVRVTDRSGALISNTQVTDEAHLKRLLTDLDGHGGLQYGQTLTLYGVKYTIGGSFAAFSNTVISRAGKHSGVAYHHLINAGSTCRFYAWKGHELDIPFAKILQARDPADNSDWSDFYLCGADFQEIVDPTAQSALHISQWEICKNGSDNFENHIKVTFTETGAHEILFTQSAADFSAAEHEPYAIKAEVRVLDVANDVYVLDFDGTVHLGKGNTDNNSFIVNDKLDVPGVKTKVRYEAFTDVAPDYADGRVSFPYGEGQNELWPEAEAASTYKLTVNLSDNTQSSGGRLVQTDLTAGTAVTQVVVSPADPVQYVFPNGPTVTENSQVKANFVPADDILFIKMNAGEDYWLRDNAIHFIYFFMDNTQPNPIWKRPYPISSDGSVYAVQIPRINGILYKNLVIVRKNPGGAQGNEPNWEDKWNQSGDISIVGFGPQKNYISTFKDKEHGGSYTFNSAYNGPAANKFGYYRISGTMTDHDVTISFPAAVSPTAITGTNSMDPIEGTRVLPRAGEQLVSAPYYFQNSQQMDNEMIPDAGAEFSSDQGSFLVRLPAKNSDNLPQLDFNPRIMDGTATIWLTSRVYEGTNPGDYLGNVDSTKEVEMFQSITVLPANVVYYEDANTDIIYNSQSEAGKPTVSWTHDLNNDGSSNTVSAVPSPDQSTNQGTAYGWDSSYVNGTMEDGFHHFSGNSSTKITFRGTVKLAEFNFTGIGFDLFSRTETNGPTVIARIFRSWIPVTQENGIWSCDLVRRTDSGNTGFAPSFGQSGSAAANPAQGFILTGETDGQTLRVYVNPDNSYRVTCQNGSETEAQLAAGTWIKTSDNELRLLLSGESTVSAPPVKSVYVATEFTNAGINEDEDNDSTDEAIYQVPVLSVQGLARENYRVELEGIGRVNMDGWSIVTRDDKYYLVGTENGEEVEYEIILPAPGSGEPVKYQKANSAPTSLHPATVESYFWLDGLRVYGALDAADQNTYYNPGEANAAFVPVRDLLTTGKGMAVNYTGNSTNISYGNFTTTVEIHNKPNPDGFALNNNAEANLAYYFLVGPNNELYLNGSGNKLQAAVFTLKSVGDSAKTFQIAAKLLDSDSFGNSGSSAKLFYLVTDTAPNTYRWEELATVQSGTELYYALNPSRCPQSGGSYTVIIGTGADSENASSSMVALTRVKYKGWEFQENYSTEMNFIRDENEVIIGITENGNNMLGNLMRLLSSATHLKPSHPFADVASGAWYADAVAWAYSEGITSGTAADAFSPNRASNRAQVVSFLWNAAGRPEAQQPADFADVPADAWYAKAVAWAVENGITAGSSDTSFSPYEPCTRAQAATFLWRYAGSPNAENGSGFDDVAADAWYARAVAWAVEHGITTGTGANSFSPSRICTRAQIVTFLYRHAEFENGGNP